jgi:hypothetical protein
MSLHLGKTADTKVLLFVRGAEDALVVGTPDGVLEDKAVGLAGRPDNDTFVFRHELSRDGRYEEDLIMKYVRLVPMK